MTFPQLWDATSTYVFHRKNGMRKATTAKKHSEKDALLEKLCHLVMMPCFEPAS
jgi:hypothetical protein